MGDGFAPCARIIAANPVKVNANYEAW